MRVALLIAVYSFFVSMLVGKANTMSKVARVKAGAEGGDTSFGALSRLVCIVGSSENQRVSVTFTPDASAHRKAI